MLKQGLIKAVFFIANGAHEIHIGVHFIVMYISLGNIRKHQVGYRPIRLDVRCKVTSLLLWFHNITYINQPFAAMLMR